MGVEWLVGMASAFGIKLSSSIDDVVWLAPFLTANSSPALRFKNSCIYTTVCMCQTVVAMLIAYSGRAAVKSITAGNKDAWSTEKILTVGAGCLLGLYSIKLTYEWIQECNEEGGEEKEELANPDGGSYAQVATDDAEADQQQYQSGRGGGWCCRNGGDVEMANKSPAEETIPIDNPEKSAEEIAKAESERSKTLFIIAFIGSIDDLTLFVPMLVGKGFDTVQLMLGAFLATSLIITFCICLGMCKPIADCLAKIPLAAIVICFATILLTKAFVFDDDKKHRH